jgi:hypothetical protein
MLEHTYEHVISAIIDPFFLIQKMNLHDGQYVCGVCD